MARHRLTASEQKKGVQKALQNPRTPPQLKKGLEKRERQLQGKTNRSPAKNVNTAERDNSPQEEILDEDELSDDSLDE